MLPSPKFFIAKDLARAWRDFALIASKLNGRLGSRAAEANKQREPIFQPSSVRLMEPPNKLITYHQLALPQNRG